MVHCRAAAILCSVNSGASMPKKCRILLAKSLVTQTTNPIMNPAELAVYFERQFENSTFHIVLGSYIYSACELAPLYAACLHFIFCFNGGCLVFSAHLSPCFAHGSCAKWCDLKFPWLMSIINSITMDQLRCQKIKWLWLNLFWLWAVAEMSHIFHSVGEPRHRERFEKTSK